MADITKEEMRERLGNIDQIRDIIFGSVLREYNNRFDKLESDMSILQQDVQDRIDQMKMVLTSDFKSSIESLEKRIKTLTLNTQEEGSDLRQQLDRINRKFSTSIEALDEAIDNQANSIRDELADSRHKLQEDVRTLKNQVWEELDRRFSLLMDVKVTRDDMAEILFELGMRLKGTEFVPAIKEATEDQVNSGLVLHEHHH